MGVDFQNVFLFQPNKIDDRNSYLVSGYNLSCFCGGPPIHFFVEDSEFERVEETVLDSLSSPDKVA